MAKPPAPWQHYIVREKREHGSDDPDREPGVSGGLGAGQQEVIIFIVGLMT